MAATKNTEKRRRKGSGSIYKNASGSFVGRISISGYEPFSCTGKTQKEVEKKLEEYRTKTIRKEVIPERISVRDYIEAWLKNVKRPSLKSASYDRLERTYLNQVKNTQVGRSQIGNITSREIQGLINENAEKYSYSTVKKVYELLNSCFTYAVACREMDFNPMLAVRMPKQENVAKKTKQMKIFTKEELQRIENVAAITYHNGEPMYRHAWFFLFLANTGLRAGEALALTWDNVDLTNRQVYIKQSASTILNRDGEAEKRYTSIITSVKTKSGNRVVPCNDKAMEALQWLKAYQKAHGIKTPYIDCNNRGELLKQQTLPKILKRILEAADVPYKNVHSFRHTFASNLIKAKVDVKVVSQLLGHHSVKITYDTYVHTGVDQAIAAVNLL